MTLQVPLEAVRQVLAIRWWMDKDNIHPLPPLQQVRGWDIR